MAYQDDLGSQVTAYVDDELSPELRQQFEEALSRNPLLDREVAFYRQLREGARLGAAVIDAYPLSPKLEALAKDMQSMEDASLFPRRWLTDLLSVFRHPWGIASTAACSLAVIFMMVARAPNDAVFLLAGQDVRLLMEKLSDGEHADGVEISSSFIDETAGFCRVAVAGGENGAAVLACFDGSWRLLAQEAAMPDKGFEVAGEEGDSSIASLVAPMQIATSAEVAAFLHSRQKGIATMPAGR